MSKKRKVPNGGNRSEVRTSTAQLEARASEGGAMKLGGYCVRFNSPANIGGSEFTEVIAPGTFTRTLKEDDQVLLRDHQSQLLLGRKSAGTLRLTQDNIGLRFDVDLPNTELGRDTYENVRLGNLKGCSFGFIVRDDAWTQDAQGLNRVIRDVQMLEATLTTFPAYESTTVNIRSVKEALERGVFSTGAIDDDDSEDCSEDEMDDDGNCPDTDDADEDREAMPDVCSACGQVIRGAEEQEDYQAALKLLLARLG